MAEVQPDMLGGKDRPGRRTPQVRKRAALRVAPAGHADKPGTGPIGETCAGCHWMEALHYRKTYHKCAARPGDHWKGGRATDIRPMDAACSKFERLANRFPAAPPRETPTYDQLKASGLIREVDSIDTGATRVLPVTPPQTTDDQIASVIAALGPGYHQVRTSGGLWDIYMGRGSAPKPREEDDDRQTSLFD